MTWKELAEHWSRGRSQGQTLSSITLGRSRILRVSIRLDEMPWGTHGCGDTAVSDVMKLHGKEVALK